MKKLSDSQIKLLLEVASYESRTREFKSPFLWNDQGAIWLKEKVIRAILGMTNTKTGGNIIIGVKEGRNRKLTLEGMTDEQLDSFEDYDGIKGCVDSFSYSDTNFDLGWGKYERKKYVIFTIQEFYEIPLICKKNGEHRQRVLRRDDIYVRSKKAPYGTIRATELELREIIKMATDKERAEWRERGLVKLRDLSVIEFLRSKLKI